MKSIKQLRIFSMHVLKKFIKSILSCLNFILPKDKKKVFFIDYAGNGHNLVALLKYIRQKEELNQYKIVFYIQNKKRYEQYSKKYGKYNVTFTSNFGVASYNRIRAKYIVCEFVQHLFAIRTPKKQIVMSTWHGMGLKKIGYEAPNNGYEKDINKTFTYQLCYSEFASVIMKKVSDFRMSKFFLDKIQEMICCLKNRMV